MKDHIGTTETGYGRFLPGNLIVIGAFREDEEDIVYGYEAPSYLPDYYKTGTIFYKGFYDEIGQFTIYDTLGREVANLVDKDQPSGSYSVNFNASSLASGIYLYRITANGFTTVKKMLHLR